MIKPFNIRDLGKFLPNEYSNPDEVFPALVGKNYTVQTLWGKDGMVQAIICFRRYWGDCWACFVLIAKNFTIAKSGILRKLIREYMEEQGAVRLQTESRANDTLRKWHRFLGFTHEGTKRKMMFNLDYDMWAIVREGV